jgi:hypothetical protein
MWEEEAVVAIFEEICHHLPEGMNRSTKTLRIVSTPTEIRNMYPMNIGQKCYHDSQPGHSEVGKDCRCDC